MPAQSSAFDQITAFLDLPKILAYGLVRGAGNLVFQQELLDKTRIAFFLLGEGPWDSVVRLWVNRKAVTLPNASIVHFHPGLDGEIGFGMTAGSTGGDQHVDAFWGDVPGSPTVVDYSRYAYVGLKVAPDPAAPSAELEVLADYQTMKCRLFDSTAALIANGYTENIAWWILDFLVRKFVLREAKALQPMVAAELGRFDFTQWALAADFCDQLPGAYALTSGMLSQLGLSAFNATQCVDGKMWTAGGMQGWHTDSAVANAWLQVDLGVGTTKAFRTCGISALGAGNAGNYKVQYSDDASAWNDAATNFKPSKAGTTSIAWADAGAHRYWRILLTNTPGAGTWLSELQFSELVTSARAGESGVVFLDPGLTADRALEQLLLMSRCYLLERSGKLALFPDKARSSVFTFTIDNIEPGSFAAKKTSLRQGKNRIRANWRELNLAAGSSNDASRFAIASNAFNHVAHQRAIGARGPALSVIPKAQSLELDFGNNRAERVARLANFQLLRQLGDDVDPEVTYAAPFRAEWTGYEDSLALEPGDVVTIDTSISEEFGGKQFELLEIEDRSGGMRSYTGLEYQPNAFADSAIIQQATEAPSPGQGIPPASGVNMSYRPLGNYLTATDAGTTATINLASGTNRVAATDIAVNSGAIAGLPYDTLEHVYFDDPTLAGGSVTYQATTTKENALSGLGRFYWGSIRTPKAGGADTVGNNDGGAGAQVGGVPVLRPTAHTVGQSGNGAVANPLNAYDADSTSYSEHTLTGAAGGQGANITLKGFSSIQRPLKSLKLKMRSSIPTNTLNGTDSVSVQALYSVDGGNSFSLWFVLAGPGATRALQVDELSLGPMQNTGLVQVTFQCIETLATLGSLVARVYEVWLEAVE